ncbi:MAG: hypothetical protein RH860_01475 [Cytophagales bacterium]
MVKFRTINFINLGHLKLLLSAFVIVLMFSSTVNAQSQDSSAIEQFMRLGKRQFEIGAYKAADVTFRKALNLRTFVPDELCYFYGNTLYQLKNYSLSQNFLNKYLELTDSNATYTDTTLALLTLLEQKQKLIEACAECDEDGFKIELHECHVCSGDGLLIGPCNRCQGSGEEVCKVCLGEKVEIQRTSFGRRYIPCTNCNETGYVQCTKCSGDGKLEYKCKECNGKGVLSRKVRVVD